MTVQKVTIKFSVGIDLLPEHLFLKKLACELMTLNPFESVFSSTGATLYFPRRFSKKWLKENGKVNLSPIPFVNVTIGNAKYANPTKEYIEEWFTIMQILNQLKVKWEFIPVTCDSGENYMKPIFIDGKQVTL